MKSISIKIKLATIFAISILIGVVLYAKADRTFSDDSEADRYYIESDASTNLDASINAHPRASEYVTSVEYTTKMAPSATQATEYLAMHVSTDDGSNYAVKQAPTPGQRPAQSASDTYQNFGVRSAVTSNQKVKTVESEENNSAYERKEVPTDYPKAVNNAAASDEAYQVKPVSQQKRSGNDYGGYAVRSAGGKDVNSTMASSKQSDESYGGYAVRSAGAAGSKTSSGESYAGYAVKSASNGAKRTATEMTAEGYGKRATPYSTHNGFFDEIQAGGKAQLAQYDNAKQGDMAYQVKSVPQSGENYGGYAVRSAGGRDVPSRNVASNASDESYGGYAVRSAGGKDVSTSRAEGGYAVKSVPQTSSSTTQYAQTSTPSRSAESEYGGYAVRSAGGRDVPSRNVAANNASDESYGGYAVRSAGSAKTGANIAQYENASNSDNAYQVKSVPQTSGESYGGYAVRSAGGKDMSSKHVASNSSGETLGGYAVRSAGGKDMSSKHVASNSSGETLGGYAVRSAGQSKSTSNESYGGYAVRSSGGKSSARQSTSVAQAFRSNRLTIYDGTKVYGNRGQRLALNVPQKDRSVIVMPKRGKSIAGVVVQDDPGRSIVVKTNSGTQSTFNYGEIDALVNI